MSLKVVFCWSDISGYMAACWRSLQELSGIELFVVAFQAHKETAFSANLMAEIPCRLLSLAERQDAELVLTVVTGQEPDVIVLCGWFHPPYRRLAFSPRLASVPMVMGMDTPWRGKWKQFLAPWVLHNYLERMAYIVVTGERSWQYASRLRVPAGKIQRGLYGIDFKLSFSLWEQRVQREWPRSFLFVGRYASGKAVDVLSKAYQLYREKVIDPWPLICCGQGPLVGHLHNKQGIHEQGFVQPDQLQSVWRSAGAFILPSRFDPWPLALVEAAATGLPLICTDACGSAVEILRPEYNGLTVPPDNPGALADALVTFHHREQDLPVWGQRSQQLAAPYAAEIWADRWHNLLTKLNPT